MTDKLDSLGTALGGSVALVGRPTFSGPPNLIYLCDAGCRPNPGSHLPVVWDGQKFLNSTPVKGTNHQASYQAIQIALEDAHQREATNIELRLTSDLVFRQLSTGGYCRTLELVQLRDLMLTLADRVLPVRMVRVDQPFTLEGKIFATRRNLRENVVERHSKQPTTGSTSHS